ncbi:MAG TPA: DnaJ family domain-containing protein [Burkholderiales bacterium]|nr:DnaJ family domain-containing protein [Burkholderiales bacterium]
MSLLDDLAERRIRQALADGEFDDLPGAGLPLDLDSDALVPEELRVAYRLLKNSGFLPPELETSGEIHKLEQLLQTVEDEDGRSRLLARINFLLARAGRGNLPVESAYYEELAAVLERRRRSKLSD